MLELEISRNKLENYIEQILIPTEKVYQIRNGKKISKERNYFPGYVLIECALVGEVEHTIQSLNNVIGFLGGEKGGDPLPMRVSEVNRILGKVDELAETDEEMNIPYVVGESVKVIDGPFNNFNGVIEEVVYVGEISKYMIRLSEEDELFILKQQNQLGVKKYKKGDRVIIGWNPEDMRLI